MRGCGNHLQVAIGAAVSVFSREVSDSLLVDLLSTPEPFSCGSPRFAACKKRC